MVSGSALGMGRRTPVGLPVVPARVRHAGWLPSLQLVKGAEAREASGGETALGVERELVHGGVALRSELF